MRISKYAFLAFVACASPALAADVSPLEESDEPITVTVTGLTPTAVQKLGDCNSLQQVPVPVPKNGKRYIPHCNIVVVADDLLPETIGSPTPATSSTVSPTITTSPVINFNVYGVYPPGQVEMFPVQPDQQAKPAVKETTSPAPADRLPSAVTSGVPIIVPSGPVPEAPAVAAAPVEPVQVAPALPPVTPSPAPQTTTYIRQLPEPAVQVVVVETRLPFTPDGIYQECAKTSYSFTAEQARIAYERFVRPPGHFDTFFAHFGDDFDAWRVYHYWKWETYGDSCRIMKTY